MVYENVMVMSFGVLPIVFQRNVDIGPCKTAYSVPAPCKTTYNVPAPCKTAYNIPASSAWRVLPRPHRLGTGEGESQHGQSL